MTILLTGSPLCGLVLFGSLPAAAVPASESGSWTDSFDVPGEWEGIASSENVTIEEGSVLPEWTLRTGTGADGDRTVSGRVYTDEVRTAITSVSRDEGVVQVNSSSGLAPGDEVLLFQMTGTGAGNWEYCLLDLVEGNRLTMTSPLAYSYYTSASSRSQLLRVPQYGDVTVGSGGVLTCSAWDGATGGVLCFRAKGGMTVSSGGSIDAAGKGFTGGGTGSGGAGGGAGTAGAGAQPSGRVGGNGGNTTGGGAGGAGGTGWPANPGGAGGNGGGSGSAGAKGTAGKAGSGPAAGAPGQGGGNGGAADFSMILLGSGGGGNGGGTGGAGAGGGGGGGSGSSAGTSGSPGNPGGTGGAGGGGGTGGGIVFISAESIDIEGNLTASGSPGTPGAAGGAGGAGGNGGNGGGEGWGGGGYYRSGGGGGGGNGAVGGAGGGGGGGGGGGAIRLIANTLTLGQNRVSATGGAGGGGGSGGSGGAGGNGGAGGGGNAARGTSGNSGGAGSTGTAGTAGGAGKIRLEGVTSSGVTQPAASSVKLGRQSRAIVTSIPVSPGSLAFWNTFDVSYSIEPGSSLVFEILDNLTEAELGKWPSSGDGQESFGISSLTAQSVRLRATLLASGANTPTLDHWAVSWSPNRPPGAPEGMAVDGNPAGSPGATNITSRNPALTWTFSDPDEGQPQGAYNISVWSGPNATGSLMWGLEGQSSAQCMTYGGGGKPGTPLQDGKDYYFSVRTRDAALVGALWGPAAEMKFHLDAAPSVPVLRSPAVGTSSVGSPVELEWNASTDPEGNPVSYEWQVSSAADFATLRANGTTGQTGAKADLSANPQYYWRVQATDGIRSSAWSEVRNFGVIADKPPRIAPLPPFSLYFNESKELNLTSYGSDDEDGTNLTWEAALTDGPGYSAQPPPLRLELRGRILRLAAGSVAGLFIVTVKAADSRGVKASAGLSVTVVSTPPNDPPEIFLEGSTLRAGGSMRLDLAKHVRDEDTSSLRWEVSTNNSVLSAKIENNSTLVLKAAKATRDTKVQLKLKVYDRYNLSDESNPEFEVLAAGASTDGAQFPWLAVAAVLLVGAVVAAAMILLARRKGLPRPAAAPAVPAVEARPADAAGGTGEGLEEEEEGPAPRPVRGSFGEPAAAATGAEKAMEASMPAEEEAEIPSAEPLPPYIGPSGEEPYATAPGSAPAVAAPLEAFPEPEGTSSDELGEIEELEMLPPEEPAPAPPPVPPKAPPPAAPRPPASPRAPAAKSPPAKPPVEKTPERDLDEILRLLNQ